MISTCWICNGTQFINNAVLRDDSNVHAHGRTRVPLVLETYGDPSAVFFKEPRRTEVRVQICVGCGHVELFAANPRALLPT